MGQEEELQKLLILADEVSALGRRCADLISEQFSKTNPILTLQERVLITLGHKMYHGFRQLVEDARRKKPEAVHHLKTVVESFIYINWVEQQKGDDKNARLLLAKVAHEKKKFFKSNPDYPEQENWLKQWDSEFSCLTKGIKSEWKEFKKKR